MARDRDEESYEEEDSAGDEDAEIATESDVTCPYCGETVTIALDRRAARPRNTSRTAKSAAGLGACR